jgi:hypothetical protein
MIICHLENSLIHYFVSTVVLILSTFTLNKLSKVPPAAAYGRQGRGDFNSGRAESKCSSPSLYLSPMHSLREALPLRLQQVERGLKKVKFW